MATLFPIETYWWFYLSFVGFVMAMLALDLGVFNRKDHVISTREALTWTTVWISLALIFNWLFYQYALWKFPLDPALVGLDHAALAKQSALEFLSGFVVEKSLAVDNIFIFVLVFSYFGIPLKLQHRVLFFGILGALIFRALFIAAGSILMQYQWVVYVFGAFLIFTGIKMFYAPEAKVEPDKNPILKLLKRLMPVTHDLHGHDFFVKIDGRTAATPMFVALIFLELSDILFAVDSVPAIFALTKEPLIVFTSNIFAILGLRSLYFVLAGAVDKFHYLKVGLAVILIFVGLKMVWLNKLFDGHFPIGISLGIIAGVLILSIVASLIFPKKVEL